jgi:HK97 family phage portal protein
MGTAGTIFQIVSLLAQSTADAEWRLYRKPRQDGRVRYTTGDQGSDMRTEVVRHQALSVLTAPNPFYTRHELIETTMQHMELTGEGFWVVQRDGRASFPTALWPIRPDRMQPVPDAEKYLAGYVYTGPSGEKVPLKINEVIQLKYPNPLDSYRGLGPVASVLTDIDAMKYSAEYNRNFFINGADPSGIIQVPGSLEDTEFNQLSDRWRESHQGVARAHRVAILESGMQWIERKYSMKDMQFVQLREVSRDVLREAWGIHKSMLGNADDVNRANAQTAEEVFGRWKVLPRLNRIRMTLNERYLPLFGTTGEAVEFDYVNPLPDDREADNAELTSKANAASVLVAAGFDPEMVCEVVGLPPMKMAEIAPAPALPEVGPNDDPSRGEPAEDDDQVMAELTKLLRAELPSLNGHMNGHEVGTH